MSAEEIDGEEELSVLFQEIYGTCAVYFFLLSLSLFVICGPL